jgi:Txe/YoeB family toxin of toxin-antitoxin system
MTRIVPLGGLNENCESIPHWPQKDAKKLEKSGLKIQASRLLDILREGPYRNPPPYEKLVGDLAGVLSRRINIQHRLVYQEGGGVSP